MPTLRLPQIPDRPKIPAVKMDPKVFQKKLLDWYRDHARDLPWRRTKDPYKIWVSEIMLQQTQVETVIPYYTRWVGRFPTLRSLAEANLSEVMKHWAGLGYYRRARMLHEAAKTVLKTPSARIPREVEALLELPGIGRYTAGAISSIAFNQKTPILDGNVIRILTRLFAIPSDIQNAKTLKKLWRLSESMLPDENPGDFNQAMMEVGATVCLPENPRCEACPIRIFCTAHRQHCETAYPVKKNKGRLEKTHTFALVMHRNGKVLVKQQPPEGRWGGLWMFPHWTNKASLLEELKKYGVKNLSSPKLRPKWVIHHGFTKYRVRLEVYEATQLQEEKTRSPGSGFRRRSCWVKPGNLTRLAFPSPHQKIVRSLIQGS